MQLTKDSRQQATESRQLAVGNLSLLVFLLASARRLTMLADGRGGGVGSNFNKGAVRSIIFLGKKNDLTSSSSSSSSLSSCRSLSSLCAAATAWSNYRWFQMSSLRRAKFKHLILTSLCPNPKSQFFWKSDHLPHITETIFLCCTCYENILVCNNATWKTRGAYLRINLIVDTYQPDSYKNRNH